MRPEPINFLLGFFFCVWWVGGEAVEHIKVEYNLKEISRDNSLEGGGRV